MDKIYWFIYNNLTDEWQSIVEVKENEFLGIKLKPEEGEDQND